MPVTLTVDYSPSEHTPTGASNVRFGISPFGTTLFSGSGIGNVRNLRRNDFYNTFDTDEEYTNASPTDSNLIDPIKGFYYQGNAAFSSLTLEIQGNIADSGWTVLFNHHNNFFLRRRDAQRFYDQSDNITKWVWTRLGAYYTAEERRVLKSFFEPEYENFRTTDLTMSFANEDIITPELKTIFRSLQYDSDITGTRSNFEMTNLQPKFPGEATGFRWDLERTRIYAKQLGTDAFLKTLPHPGLPDIGPIVKDTKNCRVYWPIDYPSNISDENQFNCLGYIHGKVPPTTGSYDNWRAKIVGKKLRSYDGSFRATITEATFAVSTIERLALDIDADGGIDALTDGLMFLRYLFNLRGEALISGAVANDAFRTTAAEIEAYIADERVQQILDFDGTNSTDALTDGLMMLRYAFNLRDDALTSGAVSNDSPFSEEEVAQRVDEAFQTMITLNNDFTVFDGGASGGGDASAGTRLTYTVDSDSLRERPASYSQDGRGHALFLEQAEDTVPHSIRNDEGTYTGNSSFQFEWLGDNFAEVGNKIITAESFLQNDPMGIIEPGDLGTGAYSADLFPSVENRQHDFIDNRARFVLQGLAGPTQEVVHSGTEPAEAILDLSPYGQLVSWKIERQADVVPSGNGYVIESQENCTVLVRQDNIKARGGSLFLSVEPGFGGETYASRVRIRYPTGDVIYKLSGNVRGPHKSDSATFNFANANDLFNSNENIVYVNNYSPALEGRDGLRLNLKLQTDIDEEDQEDYLGQLVSVSPLQTSGGELVTLAGPLKKIRSDETNIAFHQNSTYFIPDGTSDTWSFQAQFIVTFKSPTSSATYNRAFRAVANGTWKKDFGLEVLNPDGGTRLNTNTSPLRFVARGNGEAPRTKLQENQQPTTTPRYVPSGPSKTGWFHYISIVPLHHGMTRTDNRIDVYWEGTLVSQHTFTGDPDDNTPLFRVDFDTGNKYDRSSFEESNGSHKFYRVTETRSTTQFFFTYGDAPISLNGDNSPDTDFLVFNNRSESQVGIQKEAGAYDLSPSNWLKQDGTRQNGEQDFYLDHRYSLQILKVN